MSRRTVGIEGWKRELVSNWYRSRKAAREFAAKRDKRGATWLGVLLHDTNRDFRIGRRALRAYELQAGQAGNGTKK